MTKETKKLLFSVTASDCEFKYTKGSGAGGQKRNKTSNAVYCIHRPSGAQGYSEATRSQRSNKEDAFAKMAQSKEFKKWHKVEVARRTGEQQKLEEYVQREMKKVKVEVRDSGKWVDERDLAEVSRDSSG